MWHALAEEQNQHFNRTWPCWGENQPNKMQMDGEVNEHQRKQERLRTRWTAALDKIFADIVVEQIRVGNRTNSVFDKKTWNQIREEFNKQTNLNFNNNQLRKHLDVLRTRYHNLQSAVNQTDAIQDPSCYMGFDLWEDFGAQSKTEPMKTKECPIYEQLCTIFADSGVDGKYAQSSHYEEVGKSGGTDPPEGRTPRPKTPSSSKNAHGSESSSQQTNAADKKRKRPSELVSVAEQKDWNQELSGGMAKAMTEIIASSRLRMFKMPQIDQRFTIANCIKALDEIEGIEDSMYYPALDLFENPSFRETFLSLKSNHIRVTWLQGKLQNKSGNYTPLRI